MCIRDRLYTFVDRRREFALYFLEGQRLIHDLALIHPVRGAGFAYFRDAVLSVQPMIALLKPGEQLGFYIDSVELHRHANMVAQDRRRYKLASLP